MSEREEMSLSESELEHIEANFFRGLYGDWEIRRLLRAVRMQRSVLRTLFKLFHREPLRLISIADPIRNSTLDTLKLAVRMEDIP